MSVEQQYAPDIEAILLHRHDNGADLWTTPDKRLMKGAPFSTLESVIDEQEAQRFDEGLESLEKKIPAKSSRKKRIFSPLKIITYKKPLRSVLVE